MKRTISLVLALLMLATVSTLFAGGGGEQKPAGGAAAPAPVKAKVFRFADNQVDGYPTVLGDLAMAKYVEQKTNGGIKIEVYANATLGDEKTTLEQTQVGAIHFNRLGTSVLVSINPQMAALSMPYLFRDRAHLFKVLDGPIGQELLNSLQKQQLLGLCWYDAGFRNFYNTKREIKSPADMVGLKIRVQETPLMMDMVRTLGASPTPMAYGEVYSGMQNGVIDGAENNWPSYITASHVEVAKYFTVDGHMTSPEMVLINTGVWNSLSDAEKKIIKEGAAEGAKVERAAWLEAEKKYEAQARQKGSIITELTPAQHKVFQDKLLPMYQMPAYIGNADIIKRIRETQ